jgi:protease-4
MDNPNNTTPGDASPDPSAPAPSAPHSEPQGDTPYAALERIAQRLLDEQRASRRWRNRFRIGLLLVAVFAIGIAFEARWGSKPASIRHTALVEITGQIDSDSSSASVDTIIPALQEAFDDQGSVGVILRMNSPGGSPVQSAIVNDEITRLRNLHPNKPVYAVVEDMCASGCYYIAAAADQIYVSRGSIVGSIGVLMSSFGFSGLMNKLGVERRLMTAGENKAMMDPFRPQDPKHRAFTQSMLDEIHQQFIAAVKAGRGDRLAKSPEIFSGLFWTGSRAINLGLADGLGTVDSVARDVLKAEDVIDYTVREGLSDRVLKKFGAAVGEGVARTMAVEWLKPR